MVKEIERIAAKKDRQMVHDAAGFFVIRVDREKGEIVVEHYQNVKKPGSEKTVTGRLSKVIAGSDAEALCQTIAREGLVTRPEHAAYLGRELARAELALRSGKKYVQDEQ